MLFPKKALLLVFFLCLSCTSSEKSYPTKEDRKTTSPSSSDEFGQISGTVQLQGIVPKSKMISIIADPQCQNFHGKSKISAQDVLVKNGLLQNAFVYLEKGVLKKYSTPKESIVLDQKGCQYSPRILGIQVGQSINILNSDPWLHTVHAKSGKKSLFHMAMTSAGQSRKRRFKEKKILVQFKCKVHPWMTAYVGVLDHPFFYVTKENGGFSWDQVPSGKYTLTAWHERLGSLSKEINLQGDSKERIDFQFKSH